MRVEKTGVECQIDINQHVNIQDKVNAFVRVVLDDEEALWVGARLGACGSSCVRVGV